MVDHYAAVLVNLAGKFRQIRGMQCGISHLLREGDCAVDNAVELRATLSKDTDEVAAEPPVAMASEVEAAVPLGEVDVSELNRYSDP